MAWFVLQEENCIARECMLAGNLYCNMVAGRVKLNCNRMTKIVLQDNKELLEVYCNTIIVL